MNRIRICGKIINRHEQIIELSDDELQEFRNDLDCIKRDGDQVINDFLGNLYGDTDPIDWECDNWSAELIDDNNHIIEYLDCD